MAAASDGVASPIRMAPSTMAISAASGMKDVISEIAIWLKGIFTASGGKRGAISGFTMAMPMA